MMMMMRAADDGQKKKKNKKEKKKRGLKLVLPKRLDILFNKMLQEIVKQLRPRKSDFEHPRTEKEKRKKKEKLEKTKEKHEKQGKIIMRTIDSTTPQKSPPYPFSTRTATHADHKRAHTNWRSDRSHHLAWMGAHPCLACQGGCGLLTEQSPQSTATKPMSPTTLPTRR